MPVQKEEAVPVLLLRKLSLSLSLLFLFFLTCLPSLYHCDDYIWFVFFQNKSYYILLGLALNLKITAILLPLPSV